MATSEARINLIKKQKGYANEKTWIEGSIWDISSKKQITETSTGPMTWWWIYHTTRSSVPSPWSCGTGFSLGS